MPLVLDLLLGTESKRIAEVEPGDRPYILPVGDGNGGRIVYVFGFSDGGSKVSIYHSKSGPGTESFLDELPPAEGLKLIAELTRGDGSLEEKIDKDREISIHFQYI
jgi:hypothetical protein